MQTSFGNSAQAWNSELGEFISDDHRRLAEIINDYQPGRYALVYIPAKDRVTEQDRKTPFAILENKDGGQTIVRYLSETEMKNSEEVVMWLFNGDLTRHRPNDIIARIEAEEAAKQLVAMKRQEDELEDIIEFGAFMATGGSEKKHTFKHNGQVYRR